MKKMNIPIMLLYEQKIIRIIKSCETSNQLIVAIKCLKNFIKYYEPPSIYRKYFIENLMNLVTKLRNEMKYSDWVNCNTELELLLSQVDKCLKDLKIVYKITY